MNLVNFNTFNIAIKLENTQFIFYTILMKTLVTGATGFVGSHIAKKLIQAGHQVRVLRRENSSTKMLAGLPVETVVGDITDRASVFKAVQGCEAVFHVAGHVSFWRGNNELQKRINVDGTRFVVEACLSHHVKRLVHTSSIAAIGFAPEGRLGDETLPYNWWPYKVNYCNTKYLGEMEVQQGIKKGLDAVILNPAVIFGAGDLNLNSGAMIFQIARGRVPFYPEGGCCVCDVEDVAKGHLQAFLKGKTGERYILGGENYNWKDLFTFIAATIGVTPPRRKIPTAAYKMVGYVSDLLARFTEKGPDVTPESVRLSTIPCYYSSQKAIRELGYTTTPFSETVKKTYQWYRENGYLKK